MNHTEMLVTGSWDLRLVALSYVVAVFASYTALDLAGRVVATRGWVRRIWLAGGALAALSLYSVRMSTRIAWAKPDHPERAAHRLHPRPRDPPLGEQGQGRPPHLQLRPHKNSPNPTAQVSSVWHIPSVPKVEKLYGYHPTQKPLRLLRRALLASTREGHLVFDPFCGSGTIAVAAKELNSAFVGAELDEEFAKLAARRVSATQRGSLLREISEQFWSGA